jgi:predicted transcriptional regulator
MRLADVFRVRVSTWREVLQVSQEHLAKLSGLTQTRISRLETGALRATLEDVERIATAFKIAPMRLLQP